jgi:cytochrome P450
MFHTFAADTPSIMMGWWMLAYPETQARAQAELDSVADYPYLPYTRAMVKEVLSWRPVGPLGIPHHQTTKGAQAVYP